MGPRQGETEAEHEARLEAFWASLGTIAHADFVYHRGVSRKVKIDPVEDHEEPSAEDQINEMYQDLPRVLRYRS